MQVKDGCHHLTESEITVVMLKPESPVVSLPADYIDIFETACDFRIYSFMSNINADEVFIFIQKFENEMLEINDCSAACLL